MVRFIILKMNKSNFQKQFIYIPIWLDLLSSIIFSASLSLENLHSNMVRFIIGLYSNRANPVNVFTFQYG